MANKTPVFIAGCVAAVTLAACASNSTPPSQDLDAVVATAVADMCDSKIVLLGEAADHGRGATMELKSRIVQGLVEACGFDAVLVESGFYDFAQIHRLTQRGETITEAHISSAVGGVWNRYEEFAPLIPTLAAGVNGARLTVGGLDANLGSAGAFYSINAMPDELVALIPDDEGVSCRETLRRLIYLSYGRSGPSDADRTDVEDCTDLIDNALAQSQLSGLDRAALAQMVTNMRSYARFIGQPIEARLQRREDAFSDNFTWWEDQLPPDTRFIVWGASVHVAKTAQDHPRFADIEIFGTRIHERFGEAAHFASFVPVSGTYRPMGRQQQSLPDSEPDSVADTFRDTDGYRYLDASAVAALGVRHASLFEATSVEMDLASVTDSLIVIAEERPPSQIDD